MCGLNIKYTNRATSVERNDLDAILSDDLGHKVRLVDDESSLQLSDAVSASSNSFLKGHVVLEGVVQHRVHKVTSIPVSSLGGLLESAKVVHPVHFGLLFVEVVPANQHVHLVGGTSQSFCHF